MSTDKQIDWTGLSGVWTVSINVDNLSPLKNDGKIDVFELMPCPNCGKIHTEEDLESISYPMNRSASAWLLTCDTDGGGCGWTAYGNTEIECFDIWNALSKQNDKRVKVGHHKHVYDGTTGYPLSDISESIARVLLLRNISSNANNDYVLHSIRYDDGTLMPELSFVVIGYEAFTELTGIDPENEN